MHIPESGRITSVMVDGREYILDPPIEIREGDKVIDFTDIKRQVEEQIERMGDKRHRDFIESP